MVTADSVKNKIRGLIDKSNAKTGHIDKDLTTAVDTLVAGYGEGGTVLPEIDPSVLGTANDLAEGAELIGANGEIIKGSLPVAAEGSSVASAANYATMKYTGNLIYARGPYNPLNLPGLDRIVRSGAELAVPLLASAFGNASPADVAAGKTFTSQNGLKVVGTHECSGGIKLPEIDASVLGTASDLASGKQLIDADGNVVTGNVSTPNYFTKTNLPVTYDENITSIELRTKTEEDMLLRAGKSISLWARASNFGDATAADVAAGKTFTSAAGHKVVGTMEPGGGFTVTDDGAGNVTITSSAITDNNGNVVIT